MFYSRDDAPYVCRKCRAEPEHGTIREYRHKGCRCDSCRDAWNTYSREAQARFRKRSPRPTVGRTCDWCGAKVTSWAGRAADGLTLCKKHRMEKKVADDPDSRWGLWITPEDRLALYERDGWVCQLCEEPVDRTVVWHDRRAPSLDHIVPRTKGGSHEPENLQTAHMGCNSSKGDR